MQSQFIYDYLCSALFIEKIDLGSVCMCVFLSSWPKRALILNCTMKLSVQVIKQSL